MSANSRYDKVPERSYWDVAIVGGGPAGCSAAIALAGRGLRVVVLEAKRYPHHKVCGEFLSPESALLLETLGAAARVRAYNPPCIDHVRITTPDGVSWNAPLPGDGIGLSRYAFDTALAARAREAGADLREATTVTAVDGTLDDGFTLDIRSVEGASRLTARAVIGAHGKRSGFDRALDRGFLRAPQPFVGLKAHFRGRSPGACVELHAFDGGYCGLSAVEGGRVNLCLLARQRVFQRAGDVASFVRWMAAQNPALGAWLAGAEQVAPWLTIAQVPFAAKPPVERDLLMAGDSAGLIAPLAGDGMSMALQGGLLAAAWVADFLAGRVSASALRGGYASAWRREFGARLHFGRLLQSLMLRPRLLSVGLRAAATVPSLGRFFVTRTRASGLMSAH